MSRKTMAMALTAGVLTAAVAVAAPQQSSVLKRHVLQEGEQSVLRAREAVGQFEQLLSLRGVGRTLELEREDSLRNVLLALARTGAFRISFEDFEPTAGAPDQIRVEMRDTTVGEALVYLARNFGVAYEVVSRDELVVRPAKVGGVLRRMPAIAEYHPETVETRHIGDGPIPIGGEIQAPEILEQHDPEYPELARRAGLQGVVIMEATVSETGDVIDVDLLRGLGLGLDEAAIEAVKKWKYAPTYYKGEPVEVLLTVTVPFVKE